MHRRALRTLPYFCPAGQCFDHQEAAAAESRIGRRGSPPATIADADQHSAVGCAGRNQIHRAVTGRVGVLSGVGQRLVTGQHEIGHGRRGRAGPGSPARQLVTHLHQVTRLSQKPGADQWCERRIDSGS